MAGVKTQLVIDGVNKAQPAFNQANRQFFALEGAAKKAGAAIAATLSVGVIAAWVKESIDAADAARKQAQAIGLTTEALTSLQWAASQSGVSTNDLSAAFGRLNRAAMDAATGSEKQAQLFAKLGVSVTDSEGALRSGDAILMDLADRFKQLPDGVEKSALAMELFGRSGAKLIPMLNAGSDGLTQLREEAERLGLVINDKQAQEAEQFNDSISALGAQSKGAANIVSGELLPTLNTMVGLLGETASAGEATTIAANVLSGALKLLATAGIISGAQLRVVGKGLGALAAAATALVTGDMKGAAAVIEDYATEAAEIVKNAAADVGKVWDGSYEKAGQAAAEGQRSLSAIQRQIVKDSEQTTKDLSQAQKEQVRNAKAALSELVRAEKSAKSDIEKIRNDRLAIEQRYAEAIAKFRGGGQSGASFGQYQDLKIAAERSLKAGDTEGAQRQAQAALKVLEDLQAAGENTYGFEGLAKGLQSIEMAAKDIEQTRAEDTIRSLHDEITALEQKLQGVSQVDVTLTMDEAAKAKLISDMEALATQLAQTLTIKPTVVGVAAPASEPINGYATGGHIRGPGTGTSDSILARLSNGEFVMRAAAVRAYGPDFMHKLNGLQIPRFAEGGLADTATNLQTAPRNLGSLDISVGGDTFQVFTDSSQADQLRLAARKHGRTHR
ncbi:hypothetical protein ACRS81_02240 [Stutzerimonas stutzeri]|uniref:hypothetical protein n=1 Tax=Stutzerimonas stutzeri TaxID=316 RepID=UPI003EE007E4